MIGDGDGDWGRGFGGWVPGVPGGDAVSGFKYEFERLAVTNANKSEPRLAVSGDQF